jgi:hypothetical protein
MIRITNEKVSLRSCIMPLKGTLCNIFALRASIDQTGLSDTTLTFNIRKLSFVHRHSLDSLLNLKVASEFIILNLLFILSLFHVIYIYEKIGVIRSGVEPEGYLILTIVKEQVIGHFGFNVFKFLLC